MQRPLPIALVFALACLTLLGAQTPAAPAFEVVSVKAGDPAGRVMQMGVLTPGGIWTVHNATLGSLLTFSVGLNNPELLLSDRIVGLQDWMRNEKWDIEARAPAGVGTGQLVPMVQRLMADRYGLRTHIEQRPKDVYILKLARHDGRTGPQLRPSAAECAAARTARTNPPASCRHARPEPRTGNDVSQAFDMLPMSSIATLLQQFAARPVIDRTGLTGYYDVTLQFDSKSTRLLPGELATGDSLFTAVQEQLGLKLESAREPVDVLVIDAATRPEPN